MGIYFNPVTGEVAAKLVTVFLFSIMKVIICGSRTFKDYNLLKEKCDSILKNSTVTEIVSGGQTSLRKRDNYKYGADYLGELYAKEKGIPIKQFNADWETNDKSAGPIRNKEMAEYILGDGAVIAFWCGWSKGTASMIDIATRYKLPLRVIRFDPKTQKAHEQCTLPQ